MRQGSFKPPPCKSIEVFPPLLIWEFMIDTSLPLIFLNYLMVISEEIIAFIASKKKFIVVVKWGCSDKVLMFGMTLFDMRFEWLTIFQQNSTNRTPGQIIWRKTGVEIFIELIWFRLQKYRAFTMVHIMRPIWTVIIEMIWSESL